MRSPSGRRSRRSVAVDVAIVAASFVVAAMMAPALVLSFAVLLGAGLAIGLRGASDRRPIALGSVLGALLVYGWTVVREPPSDLSAALRNGLASALLLALVLGGALVLPGYLFGRAFRRSADVDDPGDVVVGPAVRSDVGAGVLILAAFAAAIVWAMANLGGP